MKLTRHEKYDMSIEHNTFSEVLSKTNLKFHGRHIPDSSYFHPKVKKLTGILNSIIIRGGLNTNFCSNYYIVSHQNKRTYSFSLFWITIRSGKLKA